MFANIVETVYPPGKRAANQAQVEEFHTLALLSQLNGARWLSSAGGAAPPRSVDWGHEREKPD